MMANYTGPERREFIRLDFSSPLAYKVCKPATLDKLFEGYTVNISDAGLRCTIKDRVHIDDILWLSFDRSVLIVCEEIERRSMIYQNGVIGKVVRVDDTGKGMFDIGIKFLMREEKGQQLIDAHIKNLQRNEK